MSAIIGFGETVEGYDVKVLNEREIRAAAGILFLFAFFAFMNVWLVGNYFYIKLFISGFLIDFTIRLLINPRYAPSLILGRLITRNQKPEYTGAPQKRFAWTIGLFISLYMSYTLVFANQATLVTCILCVVCLIFLFCETAFGICIGCLMYNLFHKEKAHFCPGGVCEVHEQEPIQKVTLVQVGLVVLVAGVLWLWASSPWLALSKSSVTGYQCALNTIFGHTTGTANSCSPQPQ